MQLNIGMQKSRTAHLAPRWPHRVTALDSRTDPSGTRIHPGGFLLDTALPCRGSVMALVDTEAKCGYRMIDRDRFLWSWFQTLRVYWRGSELHVSNSRSISSRYSVSNCSRSDLPHRRQNNTVRIMQTVMKPTTTSMHQYEHQGDTLKAETTPSTPRPHACQFPGCTKSFRRRFTMIEHAKTHSGEKAFSCPVRSCRKSFTTSGNLSRHKRAKHAWLDGPLECLVHGCGCKFSSEAKLERHMIMVHFGASSHSCPVKHCGCAFTTAGNLRRHMKQHHSHESEDKPTAVFSPSAVHEPLQFEPMSVARWSSHRLLGSSVDGSSCTLDADLLKVLAYFLDE